MCTIKRDIPSTSNVKTSQTSKEETTLSTPEEPQSKELTHEEKVQKAKELLEKKRLEKEKEEKEVCVA